jgi:hypothetical protein
MGDGLWILERTYGLNDDKGNMDNIDEAEILIIL